ncbi:hypothetical protein [Myxosarcina sp. GI1(2024)]
MGAKDFFLNPDDAQTLGDINYMRKPVRVRKTFPKTLKYKDGFEVVKEVSSMGDKNFNTELDQDRTSNTVFNPTPSSQSQPGITGGSAVTQTNTNGFQPVNANPNTKPEERRRKDNSMDMFRNMARNIRKGR